MVEKYEMNQKR